MTTRTENSSSLATTAQISENQEPISNINISDEVIKSIFTKTINHKIEQIDTKPDTNKWITRALVFFIYSGITIGIIGLGALLSHLGVKAGIPGISQSVSIGLTATGAFTVLSLISLGLASIKSTKAKKYLKDFWTKRSDWFIDSNLNDLLGTLAYSCVVICLITHIPWLNTLGGCFNYPFGALLILSGIYQGWESFKELKNANDTTNKIKQLINIFNSALLIGLGLAACLNVYNKAWAVGLNFANGTISLGLAICILIFSSFKNLNDIKKIDENNPDAIMNYLKNTLTLSEEEKKEIKNKIDSNYKTKKSCENWIHENFNKLEQETKDSIKTHDDIQEIKKMIFQQEISNAEDNKLDDKIRPLIDKQTYLEILNILKQQNLSNEELSDNQKTALTDLFKNKIKPQLRNKIIAEVFKSAVFSLFMICPALNMSKLLKNIPYDISMAFTCFVSIIINLIPRFRNIPPARESKSLDINFQLSQSYTNYIESL